MSHLFKISYSGWSWGPHQSHFPKVHSLHQSLNTAIGPPIAARSACNRHPSSTTFLVLILLRIIPRLQDRSVLSLVWAIPQMGIRCYPKLTWRRDVLLIFPLMRDWRETMSAPSCLHQPVVPLPLTVDLTVLTVPWWRDPLDYQ